MSSTERHGSSTGCWNTNPTSGKGPRTGWPRISVSRVAMRAMCMTGDTEPMPNWAGQGVGLVHRVQPAGDIVREIVEEADQTLTALA